MTVDLDGFAAEVRGFLDAAAPRRAATDATVVWGEGEDRITYFGDDSPAVGAVKVRTAKDWQRTRFEAGFGWITGPTAFGGRELSSVHDLVYDTLEREYDVPDTGLLSLIGLGMIGPTLLAHAQPGVQREYLPALYRGEIIACQLFSEPAAGSDLAALETKAVRDGDGWVLNGQKVWTSGAHYSDFGLALCRTDPDKPKHRGITAFVVDLATPGVEIRPLRQMSGGAEFNEVFLTDVRVADDHRVGEVDGGWQVALTTLMNERASVGGEGAGPATRAISLPFLAALLAAHGRLEDPASRRRLAEIYADQAATDYLNRQSLARVVSGAPPGPEASVSKLMYGQNITRSVHFAAEIVGPGLIADTGAWGAYSWTELLLSTPALRILGGTEEIMKNILAERVLGLPKEPGIDTKSPFRELRRSETRR
jgi:alkylation response protein AidB-like acyl-CoA dehydrogenase